jgi:hypothetical protein
MQSLRQGMRGRPLSTSRYSEENTMEAASATRVLIVANRTAATPLLLDKLRERAREGPCTFTLLVPRFADDVNPEGAQAQMTLEVAVPAIREATRSPVVGVVGDADPFSAVRDFVNLERPDEVIVSMLPERCGEERVRRLALRETCSTSGRGVLRAMARTPTRSSRD